jgi:hypothetical protein
MNTAIRAFYWSAWTGAGLAFLIFPLTLKTYARPGLPTVQGTNSSPAADAAPPKAEAGDPKGTVEGHTYKNAYLGLEFTLPDELQFQEQPAAESDPATGRMIISTHAGSKPGNRFAFRKYIVDEAIMFVADPLARHPVDERTDAGYIRGMVRVEKAQGFKQTGDSSVDKIGDTTFSRANFVHGSRYHVVFATERKDYAFVFIFVGNDFKSADALAKATTVKLPQ